MKKRKSVYFAFKRIHEVIFLYSAVAHLSKRIIFMSCIFLLLWQPHKLRHSPVRPFNWDVALLFVNTHKKELPKNVCVVRSAHTRYHQLPQLNRIQSLQNKTNFPLNTVTALQNKTLSPYNKSMSTLTSCHFVAGAANKVNASLTYSINKGGLFSELNKCIG